MLPKKKRNMKFRGMVRKLQKETVEDRSHVMNVIEDQRKYMYQSTILLKLKICFPNESNQSRSEVIGTKTQKSFGRQINCF